MAHELGHYLGLLHNNALNNLMNPTVGSSTTVLVE
jgi:predicted Zn-dependent protease